MAGFESVASTLNTYFEIHSYDGGFKPELIPSVGRPSFLPDPPGPRSNELELRQGDFAVELTFSKLKGHNVVWIGYYIFGTDRQLGARGNYCGVGVWLIDLAPIYIARLLKFLNDAALNVSKNNGPSHDLRERLKEAVNQFSGLHWCVPFKGLPRQFWSARFDTASGGGSSYFALPDDQKAAFWLVAADILHQFSRKPREGETVSPRHLYMPKRSSKIAGSDLLELDHAAVLASEEDAIWDFCEATAEPTTKFNELTAANTELQQTLENAKREAREKSETQAQRIANLEAALAEAEKARIAIEAVFETVSNAIPNIRTADSSGARSSDSVMLREIRDSVTTSQSKISAIHQNIASLSREGRAAQGEGRAPYEPYYRNGGDQRARSWPAISRFWAEWKQVILDVVLIVMVVVAVGFVIGYLMTGSQFLVHF